MRPDYYDIIDNPAPYLMVPHKKSKKNKKREDLLKNALKRLDNDGFSKINECATILDIKQYPYFTYLKIKII